MNKKELGKIGEEISCQYLKKLNYKIVERNFMCRQGEIDIIAKEKEEYVFMEVKTRSNLSYGTPIEAVDFYKKKHIYQTTKYYLYSHNLDHAFVRFDVMEVYLEKSKYKLRHIKAVDVKWF